MKNGHIRRITALLLVFAVLCALGASASAEPSINLATYDGGYFSLMLPEGW